MGDRGSDVKPRTMAAYLVGGVVGLVVMWLAVSWVREWWQKMQQSKLQSSAVDKSTTAEELDRQAGTIGPTPGDPWAGYRDSTTPDYVRVS